jgi:hypothetical protein
MAAAAFGIPDEEMGPICHSVLIDQRIAQNQLDVVIQVG